MHPEHDMPAPEWVIQQQLDAYNAHDLDRYIGLIHDNCELREFPDRLLACGIDEIRSRYAGRFADANLSARLISRTVVGNLVVDHEMVTSSSTDGLQETEMLAMYEVIGRKIMKAWFKSHPRG